MRMQSRSGLPLIRPALFLGVFLTLVLVLPTSASASWSDRLKGLAPETGATSTPETRDDPASPRPTLGAEHSTMVAGLKEALEIGGRRAIESAGQRDGFLGNDAIKIPLPGLLENAGSMLRGVGLGRQADQFEESMNRAAEKAVPEAADLLTAAIADMTIDDARAILVGAPDSATRYLRRQAGDPIAERFRPIVAESMQETGVTTAYTTLTDQLNTRLPGLEAMDDLDLNAHVTAKTLDGLFLLLAQEEGRIRNDPAARTTALLQEVFGR